MMNDTTEASDTQRTKWVLGIWGETNKLPHTLEYQIVDHLDSHGVVTAVRFSGLYRVDGDIVPVEQYREAMAECNAALSGLAPKARYRK